MNEKLAPWQLLHEKIIQSFLFYLNKQTNQFILKGGTALRLCYGLDRFSEDIDLDATKQRITEIVRRYCLQHRFSYRIAKDTHLVCRCFIHYANVPKDLKIEVSYRRRFIAPEKTTCIGNIKVYTLDAIARMKADAYLGRDRLRDLYDLAFIINKHKEKLSPETLDSVAQSVQNKGLEQFDYLIATQADPLLDKNKLATDFLSLYEKLGLNLDDTPVLSHPQENTLER